VVTLPFEVHRGVVDAGVFFQRVGFQQKSAQTPFSFKGFFWLRPIKGVFVVLIIFLESPLFLGSLLIEIIFFFNPQRS